MPRAKIELSNATIGISVIQKADVVGNAHTQIAPPAACELNVETRLRATKNLFLAGHAAKGISQKRVNIHASLPIGFAKNETIPSAGIISTLLLTFAKLCIARFKNCITTTANIP